MIPAIDMLNHSTDPSLRNTSLALGHGDAEVKLEDGQTKCFTKFFLMRAGDVPQRLREGLQEGTQ
jgi:hypothetical protein